MPICGLLIQDVTTTFYWFHMSVCRSEDVSKREGVRRRPRSAKRSKSRSSRGEGDRHSHVTLSEGSYEEVKLDDSESEDNTYYEDRGCQTGWELFVHYDQVCHHWRQ